MKTWILLALVPDEGDSVSEADPAGCVQGPTTFWMPPIIYLIVKKPKINSGHWWASWFCIIYGLIVTIFGA